MKKIFIILLLILNLVACKPKLLPPFEKNFYVNKRWPVVELVLNGKKAWFLIDSGSMGTLLNSSDKFKYGFVEGRDGSLLNGFGGASIMLDAYHVNLEFNNIQLITEFHSQSLDNLLEQYEEETNLQIVGILGTDIFLKYHFIIDYSKGIIIIQD